MKAVASTFLTCAMLAVAVAGCGGSGQRPVHGAVTLDGAPLERGTISFRPVDPTTSRGSGATIQDGRYAILAAHGLPPGRYLVTIDAQRVTGKMVSDPEFAGQRPEVARVVFAEKQPFEATIAAGGDNVLDFRLTSARQSH